MNVKIDTSVFQETMRAMARIPGRYGPEILNTGLMKILVGTGSGPGLVQLTPKASQSQIESDLLRGRIPDLAMRLARKTLKKRGAFTEKEVKKLAATIVKARVRSRSYIAAGWLVAAKKLARHLKNGGGLTRVNKTASIQKEGKMEASKSFVVSASSNRLSSAAFNTSEGAQIVAPDGLVQIAVNNAQYDMSIYVERKLGAAVSDAINNGQTADSVLGT